jgi:hypothetical protein
MMQHGPVGQAERTLLIDALSYQEGRVVSTIEATPAVGLLTIALSVPAAAHAGVRLVLFLDVRSWPGNVNSFARAGP